MKSLLSSTTIQGVILSIMTLVLSHNGIHVDKDEARGIISGVMDAWPELVGIGTALAAAWHRVHAWDFDKSIFASRTFWLGLATSIIGIMNAAGMPTDGMQDIVDHVAAVLLKLGPIMGGVIIIIGRAKAKLPVRIERARPL